MKRFLVLMLIIFTVMYSFVGTSLIYLARWIENHPGTELEINISFVGWIVLSAGFISFIYLFHLLGKK